MTLLEKLLADVEKAAAEESMKIGRDFPTIERAYAIADRLKAVGFDAMVTIHTHFATVKVSIHADKHEDAAFRQALAAIGIAPSDKAGYHEIEPNIETPFHADAEPLQEAA